MTEDSNRRLYQWLKTYTWGHLVVLSALVGIIAGLGAYAFSLMLQATNTTLLVRGAGYVMPQPGAERTAQSTAWPARRWLLLIIPTLGGLASGLLIYSLAPEAEGHGTDAVIDAFHRRRGIIRRRVPFIKTIASVLTIGSGGSAGREGPIGQIGAGFGSALGDWLRRTDRERRLLVLAGAGAGIGAIFRAPLGGALFIAEVLYRDSEFESAALVPAFVASIVAYSLYCSLTGTWGPIFTVPPLQFLYPLELPFCLVLAAVCSVVGMVYVKVFYGLRDRVFRPLRLPNHVKPAIGGLAVGIMALFVPEVLGMGYGWAQQAIDGTLPLRMAILLPLLKILATALTIGSGGSGGVFAPSIVIGGMLGAAAGMLFHGLFPGVVSQPAEFVLVGMAAFFAGVAKVPLASLVMVSEMTSGYGLLVPLMLANAVAFLLVPSSLSIYSEQVKTRLDSPVHRGEFFFDVLEQLRVKDALDSSGIPILFQRNTPLEEVLQKAVGAPQQVFPVLNADFSLYGVIGIQDLRWFMTTHGLVPGLVVAEDLCTPDLPILSPEESLSSALNKFRAARLDELPVVRQGAPPAVIGLLSRRQINEAYRAYAQHVAQAEGAEQREYGRRDARQ